MGMGTRILSGYFEIIFCFILKNINILAVQSKTSIKSNLKQCPINMGAVKWISNFMSV